MRRRRLPRPVDHRSGNFMSASDAPPPAAVSAAQQVAVLLFLKKMLIWGLFLAAVYLARDFFFMAFMTFMFSYLTLAVVGWAMTRLSPQQERPWLRRALTVACF